MSLLERLLAKFDSLLAGVGIQKDKIILLNANEVECFLWPTSNNPTIQFTQEECLNCTEVLLLQFIEA